jgi:hypothetical protein
MATHEKLVVPFVENLMPMICDVASGARVDLSQCIQKGYDYIRDGGATFTANLEASVSGQVWTVIAALAASGQGAIAAHYNYVRTNCTVAGAKGATTKLIVAGLNQ